jgi:UDP-3-O-[3-hydroxymyristoyl] glucosamine N-acyltransferase
MDNLHLPTTAESLAQHIDAVLIGDKNARVEALSPLDLGRRGTLSFFADKKYAPQLARLSGGVVLTHRDLMDESLPLTYLLVEQPKKTFASLAQKFLPKPPWTGISQKTEQKSVRGRSFTRMPTSGLE